MGRVFEIDSACHSLTRPPAEITQKDPGMRAALNRGPLVRALLTVGAALLFWAPATRVHAAGINGFKAAAGPHNYLVTNHPAVLRHNTPSAWLITSYAHDPLVCRDAQGKEIHKIVEHQVNGELAAAYGLFDRFEIGGVLPAVFLNGPSFEGVAGACQGFDPQGVTQLSAADPRIMGKFLLTPWNEGFVASLRLQAEIPLAQLNKKAGQFLGETFPNLTPGATVGFSSRWVKFAADLGYLVRAPSKIGDLTVGHEINYGAGAELTVLPEHLFATADVFGRAAPAFLLGSKSQYPLEGALALKGFVGPVVLLGGLGAGVVEDFGAPEFRVFAGIGFYPLPPPEPEPPVEVDSDGDGYLDSEDGCPQKPEDFDDFEDEDGCPDLDNDGDDILDADDACPNEAEDLDRWQDEDGCPDPDNDDDGILDGEDECPNDPEVINDFEDEDGCPDNRPEEKKKIKVVVRRERIEIKEKVFFAYDSARILPQSYDLLDKVAEVIKQHQEIPAIAVEGHTDSDGSDEYNLDLSQRRVESVRRYLIAAGVDPFRLTAEGFGESRPLVPNDSEEHKAMNRRVEFRIVEATDGATDEGAAEDDVTEEEGGDADTDQDLDDGDTDEAGDDDFNFEEG